MSERRGRREEREQQKKKMRHRPMAERSPAVRRCRRRRASARAGARHGRWPAAARPPAAAHRGGRGGSAHDRGAGRRGEGTPTFFAHWPSGGRGRRRARRDAGKEGRRRCGVACVRQCRRRAAQRPLWAGGWGVLVCDSVLCSNFSAALYPRSSSPPTVELFLLNNSSRIDRRPLGAPPSASARARKRWWRRLSAT